MGRSAALFGLADVVTALSLHAEHPGTFGSHHSSGLQYGWVGLQLCLALQML